MHSYASDSPDRRIAPWIIAIFAVGVAFLYGLLSRMFRISSPWWCEAPSIMSVYGIIHWVYSSRLWRCRVCGLRLSGIPNCNGTWYGPLHSSYNGGTNFEGMLVIHQTWGKMVIEFRTDSSASYSRMAALYITPGPSEGLIYEYASDPRADAKETMHAHRGFAFLKLSTDRNWLEGDYYTGRDRTTYGTMRLRRLSPRVLDFYGAKKLWERIREEQNDR
jgi:hypothetical protein